MKKKYRGHSRRTVDAYTISTGRKKLKSGRKMYYNTILSCYSGRKFFILDLQRGKSKNTMGRRVFVRLRNMFLIHKNDFFFFLNPTQSKKKSTLKSEAVASFSDFNVQYVIRTRRNANAYTVRGSADIRLARGSDGQNNKRNRRIK